MNAWSGDESELDVDTTVVVFPEIIEQKSEVDEEEEVDPCERPSAEIGTACRVSYAIEQKARSPP